MYAIETEKLTKYYGKARGIENVDLTVEEGEIFGFIGPNGAGKSTTIRTILALIRKTSGKATVFGLDCEKEYKEVLGMVGYLPSEVFYYDNMKAKHLLRYSASFYGKDCTERIQELATVLDLDLDKKIEDMSFGNKKKVGIIQGLLHNPKLIILDEPTGGLDPLMQKTFFELIKEENARGATVLFSSHILSEVEKLCDRVAIIKEGTIIETRKISELSHTYKKVRAQLKEGTSLPEDWQLPGMSERHLEENAVSFLYQGEIGALLETLQMLSLTDLDLSEPDLEEVFLHYYR